MLRWLPSFGHHALRLSGNPHLCRKQGSAADRGEALNNRRSRATEHSEVFVRATLSILIPATLLLAGCSEWGLNGRTDRQNPGDTDDPTLGVDGWDELWPPVAGERCNGLDDDQDGLVDEGFPDTDGDGIADCLDDTCEVLRSEAQPLEIDRTCAADGGEPIQDPWEVRQVWAWRGADWAPESRHVITPPVVARVTDDDFDGRVTVSDPPDVAFVSFDLEEDGQGLLWLLDGESGGEHWAMDGIYALGGVALADLDGVPGPEIVTFDEDRHVVAFDRDGVLLWRSTRAVEANIPGVTVADVDGNGVTDVIADTLRLDGRTGAELARFLVPSVIARRLPAVGDVDLDGQQEIIIGDALFEPDGTRTWQRVGLQAQHGHWGAILEADDDPQGEIAMIADGRLEIFDHDGTLKVSVESGNDHPGAPCVADFDGDGEAEIAWASNNRLVLHDLDGSEVWARDVVDATGLLATCSGFDFDGDGAMELLYNDNLSMYILDGRTGAVRYSNPEHASTTIWEYPTIADLDADGAAEVLVASNTLNGFRGWSGITVLEHLHDQWMPANPSWPTHDYSVTNVLDDGTVPAEPEPSWQRYNVYRARPAEDSLAVDLQASVTDVCYAGCKDDALALVAVQVWNAGTENSATGVPVALYTKEGERLELLGVQRLGKRVAGGWISDTLVFEVRVGRIGADGFVVRVDDDGTGDQVHPDECDETNNEGA